MSAADTPPGLTRTPREERVPWGFLDALGAFGLVFLLTAVLQATIAGVTQTDLIPGDLGRALFLPLSGVVLGGTAWGWLRIRYGPPAGRILGDRRPDLRDAGLGVLLGIGIWVVVPLLVGFVLEQLLPEPPTVQEGFRELARDPTTLPLLLIGAVVVAPVAEELFFRGLLFRGIEARLGAWPGIGLSSLVFALVHLEAGADQVANLFLFIVIFPLGMLLAWSFQRSGTLVVPIATHAVFNLIQTGFLITGAGNG